MSTRFLPMRLRWTAMILVALFCAVVAPAAAQQASPSAAAATVQAPSPAPVPEASTPAVTAGLSGPRLHAPTFQDVESVPARSHAQASPAAAPEANHTIVVSTLAIVLAAIIVVLLLVH